MWERPVYGLSGKWSCPLTAFSFFPTSWCTGGTSGLLFRSPVSLTVGCVSARSGDAVLQQCAEKCLTADFSICREHEQAIVRISQAFREWKHGVSCHLSRAARSMLGHVWIIQSSWLWGWNCECFPEWKDLRHHCAQHSLWLVRGWAVETGWSLEPHVVF